MELTVSEAVSMAITPSQPHEFDYDGHTYRIILPAHFLTTQTADRDYYQTLLTDRIRLGYIKGGTLEGILAGSYRWERTA